jgi:hypothetical protein
MIYPKQYLSIALALCFLARFTACYAAESPLEQQLPPPDDYQNSRSAVKYVKSYNHYVFEYVFGSWKTTNSTTEKQTADRFSTKNWLEKNVGFLPDHKPTRHGMLPDLFNSYSLIGMTREDVHKLLGPPEERKLKETGSNIDSYLTSSGPCANAGSGWIEILYKSDTVAAYRTIHVAPIKATFAG